MTTDGAADWAASGVVTLTGRGDGPPVVPPGTAATTARRLAERLGEVSDGRIRLDGAALLGERAAFTRRQRAGAVSVGGQCRLLRTSDGWAAVSCARPDDPLLLGALVGQEIDGDPWPPVTAWLAGHPGAELAERAELLGLAAAPVRRRAVAPFGTTGSARSAVGLLVVDFSALWAGPLCAQLLGMAGGHVVKVETPTRPDGARHGEPGFYRLLHAGHRSVVLDPSTASGRRAMGDLVAAADIVVEASRPCALAGFGLDAVASTAAGTTWISITAAGRASPRIGFGDDVAAGAGMVAPDADGTLMFCGDAIADPLTGLTAATLALTTPAGSLLDIAMADVVAATLDGVAAGPARCSGDRWVLDTEDGPVPVLGPRARPVGGDAPRSGADTDQVQREIGARVP